LANVIALRALFRLLLVVSPALLLTTQPLDVRLPASHVVVVGSHERDVLPPRADDLVTRKQRHAASLEEFFAIDDDSDQSPPSSVRIVLPALLRVMPLAAPRLPACHPEAPPSHKPCAGPQTGPPTA
jgi:hypothetical protein